MTSEIVERDGKLFVLDPWGYHLTKPIRYQTAWPTRLLAKDYPQYIGQKVTAGFAGEYRFADGTTITAQTWGGIMIEDNPFRGYVEYEEETKTLRAAFLERLRTGDPKRDRGIPEK